MSAIVIILPPSVDPLVADELHEQRIQEQIRLIANRKSVPPRTRPVLAVSNEKKSK